MADFTLFEVHLHDGFEFSPSNRAPLFAKSERAADDYDAELEAEEEYEFEIEVDEDESESEAGRGASLLVGFVLLVGIAAAVRFIRGRGDDEMDELADLDREEIEIDA
ncbi:MULTISPECIES: hypothetical protein [Haloferax]|uniref:Transmembrane protein n=1 Tax=Haloferax marinum TaxID=2666143 RepID=A0A6A8GB85_9EURY|nr:MULTISPECIES: hypothetical protein [Haloferax]KAB1198792.1 hypothetical protein Hfx1150_15180 [Haloferax sp. CBA1150]MRW97912.1 hypothetical protein [Haloferax marinum]